MCLEEDGCVTRCHGRPGKEQVGAGGSPMGRKLAVSGGISVRGCKVGTSGWIPKFLWASGPRIPSWGFPLPRPFAPLWTRERGACTHLH